MILSLIIGILTLVAEWMIFKKMGRQGWGRASSPSTTPMCCVRSCTATAGSSFCC